MSGHATESPKTPAAPDDSSARIESVPMPLSAEGSSVVSVAPVESPASATAAQRGFRFAVLLVLCGTLPIGIGVGFALRPRPVPSPVSTSAERTHSEPAHEDSCVAITPRSSQPDDWRKADEQFLGGEFELALRQYQSKGIDPTLRPSDPFQFRLAAVHEVLAIWETSRTGYQALLNHRSDRWRDEALLGQVRVLLGQRRFPEAQTLLTGRWNEGNLPPAICADVAALLAITQTANCFAAEAAAGTQTPELPLSDLDVLRSLAVTSFRRTLHPADGTSELAPDPHAAELSRLIKSVLSAHAEPPAGEPDAVDCCPQELAALVRKLLTVYPDHMLTGELKLSLGLLAYRTEDWDGAVEQFTSLTDRTAKRSSLVAAYNLGLTEARRRDYRAACRSLGQAVTGMPGDLLSHKAMLLRGQLALEIGDAEQAAFDFQRVASQSMAPQEQSRAIALMGAAQLIRRQPLQAAQWMFHRRHLVEDSGSRAAAGFVNSLARLQSLTGDDRHRELTFLYRALKGLESEGDWLGNAGALLIGRAYHDLGLNDEMATVYQKALAGDVHEPYRSEMRYALAVMELEHGNRELGRQSLVELHTNPDNPQSHAAGMRLAQHEFEIGNWPACVTRCRELAVRQRDPHILRLMGKAFEAANDSHNAALCFAGEIPDDDLESEASAPDEEP